MVILSSIGYSTNKRSRPETTQSQIVLNFRNTEEGSAPIFKKNPLQLSMRNFPCWVPGVQI